MRYVPICKLIRKDLLLLPSEHRYFRSGDKSSPLGIQIDQSHKRMIRELVAKVIGCYLFDHFREWQYLELMGRSGGTFSRWATDQETGGGILSTEALVSLSSFFTHFSSRFSAK